MSTEIDWLKAREEYANRVPDPSHPKLPQSGTWLDEEMAFFLNEDVETFRGKVKTLGIPHRRWGNRVAVCIDDFARWRLYGEKTAKEDDNPPGKRERVDLAAPERPVRGGGKRPGKPGKEAPQGDGSDVRARKGRKGST